MTQRNGSGLANAAATWLDSWRPTDPEPDPLLNELEPVQTAQRPGRPSLAPEQTTDVQRDAMRDLTIYVAKPDGSAVQPMSGLHGVIGETPATAHESESERQWDFAVTQSRNAPRYGWDHGSRPIAPAPDAFGLVI